MMPARTSSSSVCRSMRLQPGQLAQLHVEDVVGLDLAELERCRHQPDASGRCIVAGPDERDDLVDDIERLDAPLEDVLAAPGLVAAGTASAV